MNKLGLTSKPFTLKYQGQSYKINPPPLEVHKIRPAFRIGREGRQIQQVVISLSQTVRLPVKTKSPNKRKSESLEIIFRGGCTLILSLDNLNKVEYSVIKNVRSQRRFDQQMEYQAAGEDLSMNLDTYKPSKKGENNLNFKHLHFHSR